MTESPLDLCAARTGHFFLESGHHGELWLDLDRLFLHPARLDPWLELLATGLAPLDVDVLCGPESGGALAGFVVAAKLDVAFVSTERVVENDGTVRYVLGDECSAHVRGRRVAVVDDAINAGSATRGSIAALEAAGATVIAIGGLIVLGETIGAFAADRGIPLIAVTTHPQRLWAPDTCPHCAAGVPLERLLPDR